MRLLILGGDSLVGHQLRLSLAPHHEVRVTLHGEAASYRSCGLLDAQASYFAVDARDPACVSRVLDDFAPHAVINGVGMVKRDGADDPATSIAINALFPHQLAAMCKARGSRVIHFSTDCVFDGRKGNYSEADVPDAATLHGRCKILGELDAAHCLTIRSSFIGLEVSCKRSLVEWFLAQRGPVKGYRRAIYSGLTTLEVGRLVQYVLEAAPSLAGIWHVASRPISKYDLLCGLARRLGRTDVEIIPYDGFVCDRSLNGAAFAQATGYLAPGWDAMLDELAAQITERGWAAASR